MSELRNGQVLARRVCHRRLGSRGHESTRPRCKYAHTHAWHRDERVDAGRRMRRNVRPAAQTQQVPVASRNDGPRLGCGFSRSHTTARFAGRCQRTCGGRWEGYHWPCCGTALGSDTRRPGKVVRREMPPTRQDQSVSREPHASETSACPWVWAIDVYCRCASG